MRVSDSVRKCVVCLGLKDGAEAPDFGGTAFVVNLPGEKIGNFQYLVTAKHCLDKIGDRPYVIRMNTRDGGSHEFDGKGVRWWSHEDRTVDAAVTPFINAPSFHLDLRAVGIETFLTDEDIVKHQIGPGDEVFMTGLFKHVAGQKKNLPIARLGSLALIPDEQVYFHNGFMDAYLVESRSIGGLSGSPAFVSESVEVPYRTAKSDADADIRYWAPGQTFFLGVVRGHWDAPPNGTLLEAEKVNMGICVVVPANKIREILYLPEFVEMRREAEERLLKDKHKDSSALDSSFAKPFTKDDFESALKKASRKIGPSKH